AGPRADPPHHASGWRLNRTSDGSLDPAVSAGDAYRLVPVGGTGLADRGGQVVADGTRRQRRPAGDLLDRGTFGGQFQDVGLARGQRVVAGADRLRRELRVDVPAAAGDGTD